MSEEIIRVSLGQWEALARIAVEAARLVRDAHGQTVWEDDITGAILNIDALATEVAAWKQITDAPHA